uniref:Uncharacterized protein n=1 Tax=Glossina austeni TaxID=7395 RepID=A0A1A9VE51_GLOAU
MSANLANAPCPQRVILLDWYAAIRRPDLTQPTQLNQLICTRYNGTYSIQSQRPSSTPKVYSDNQPPSKQVNLVKSGLLANEISHACPTEKEVKFEEATPSTSLHSPPRSDQYILSPIVTNVNTRPLPLGQWSDISTLESQRYKTADTALRQQEPDVTPDGMAPVVKQQSSLPQQQVPTETSTQASPTSQWMPTYSNVNSVTPLQQYKNHNDNITTTTTNSITTAVTTSPTNRVLPMQQRQYVQRNGNENKTSYETEVKRISSHSPLPNDMKGNINSVSNQLQQQSALHNRPLLQANVTKYALPSLVAPPALTYKITDLVEKATNKVSKQQQQTQSQQTAPQRKGRSSPNKHIHKVMKDRTLKENL